MQQALVVFIGSGLGGTARYVLGRLITSLVPGPFPTGTVTINVTGSLLIALVMGLSQRTAWIGSDLRLFLTTGIMGGYTTYSSFNYETLALVQSGRWGQGVLNVVVTVAVCIGSGALGLLLAKVIASA